ncbi:hypothetical protein [Streptomyces sp. 2A115]|uniref:hypothetical protein n=1 Tax=Streptomyces sp. 2A115 TaxID=3457439 RepID=UPI003FD3F457
MSDPLVLGGHEDRTARDGPPRGRAGPRSVGGEDAVKTARPANHRPGLLPPAVTYATYS